MFKFRLVLVDGSPAVPASFVAAVPSWKPGDVIPLGAGKSYRVVDVRPHPTLNGTLVVAARAAATT